jgi:hypothetical protein
MIDIIFSYFKIEGLIYEEISVLIDIQGETSCFSVGVVSFVDRVERSSSNGIVIFVVSDLIDLVGGVKIHNLI